MTTPSQLVGQILGHYRILEQIGAGGMGVVYRAHDQQLDREVAVKVLPVGALADEVARKRFRKEALALAKLNHPNIATIFEFSSQNSTDYLVTEYISGQTLDTKLATGALCEKEVVGLGIQLAQGLSAAHEHGIVHRDLKPANLRLTADGRLKILDFGLAQLMPHASEIGLTATLTKSQEITGTLPYMAPEQLRGEPADARTDIWAAGAVLYEMATAHRPFEQKVPSALTDDIIHKAPPLPRRLRSEVSPKLESVILRCLEKEQTKRYQSARELGADLDRLQQLRTAPKPAELILRLMRKPQVAIPGLLLLLVVAVGTTLFVRHNAKVRWAKRKALPEIAQLFEKQDYAAAFRLARQVEGYIPDDPLLNRLLVQFSLPISINTSPPGADVYVKLYSDVAGAWNYLGKSPLRNVRVPFWSLRWKITKLGYETIERGGLEMEIDLPLDPQGSLPPRMVRVQKGNVRLGVEPAVEVPDLLIDKYEATNREFKRFVESDGYRKREYWKEKFVKDGRELSWEEALAEFHDATNRPGPSTWEGGDYAPGQDELPVSGVSWYEAAAYAEFVGKSLPTVYEWKRASSPDSFADILQLSNFGGKSPAPVGTYQGIGPYGTYDMAGNVKEWCWNATGSRRYILGGAWNEAPYMFATNDARAPFERSSNNGFRLVKHLSPQPYPEALTRPIEISTQDYSKIMPVSEEVFKAYKSLYAYDRGPLAATVEEVETVEAWRRERVSFNAAYGNERVIAYLFLPRNVSPPYQAVVYFPHAGAFVRGSSRNADMMWVDFIIKSGRAVMFPIYKGSYDRFAEVDTDSAWRDMVIEQQKDFARSIDYLETRPEIDRAKLAYYGISTDLAPIMISLEKRLKAAVLVGAGFSEKSKFPETEPTNFAPRVTVPVLMINGRYDFFFPLDSSQDPLFRLLGTPPTLKRHAVFETGHLPPRNDIVRATLDWLDRYLGPVK